MNLDDIKQKANDIRNDLEPKVKETARKAGSKMKYAGEKVSDFATDTFNKIKNSTKNIDERDIVDGEYKDITDLDSDDDDSHQQGSGDDMAENNEVNENEKVEGEVVEEVVNTSAIDESTDTGKGNKKKPKKNNKRNSKKNSKKSTEVESAENVNKGQNKTSEDIKEGNLTSETEDNTENNQSEINSDTKNRFGDPVGAENADNSGTFGADSGISDDNDGSKEDKASDADESDKTEIERIEGVVVGTMKDKIEQFKTNVLPKVKDAASNVGNKVADTATSIAPKTVETVQNVGHKVKETVTDLAPKAKETLQNIGPKAKETVQNFGPKAKETAKNIGNSVKKTGPFVYENAKKAGETISFQGYRIRKTLGKKMKNSIKRKLGFDVETDSDIKYVHKKHKKTNKFTAHFRTVMNHKKLVFKHCVKAGIPLQGLTHDLSKFSPTEFFYGVKFYKGDKSPNEGEREDHGFSYAWMHHKGRNKHHFEYWNDYNIEANKALPVKMPLKYVIEMFCDRVAASKVYLKHQYTNKCPYDYFDKGRSRRTIHQETSDFLEKLLKMLADKGEPYTFLYIRWYMKHHKDY